MEKCKKIGLPFYSVTNLLKRNFETATSLQKLNTDITYLLFEQKQLHLSSIQSLYNITVISYSIRNHKIHFIQPFDTN